MCIGVLPICMPGHLICWNWNYRQLWGTMCMLGTESWYSKRTVRTPNHRAISPTPTLWNTTILTIPIVLRFILLWQSSTTKSSLGRKWFISSYSLQSIIQGNQRQEEPGGRSAAYWLASHGLLSLPSYRTQDHQSSNGTAHSELGCPTAGTKEMPQSHSSVLRKGVSWGL